MKKTLFAIALISLPVLMFSQNKFLFNPSVGFAWRTAEKPSGLTAAEKRLSKTTYKWISLRYRWLLYDKARLGNWAEI